MAVELAGDEAREVTGTETCGEDFVLGSEWVAATRMGATGLGAHMELDLTQVFRIPLAKILAMGEQWRERDGWVLDTVV